MNFFGGYQPKDNKRPNVPYSGSKVKKYIDEEYVKVLEKRLKLTTEIERALQKENEQLKADNERLRAINEAELDTIHKLGEDYEKTLEKINCQQEEIEFLKDFIEKDQGLIIKLTGVPVSEYNQKIKSEAIKEFADKVKEIIPKICWVKEIDKVNIRRVVDNLVKEMVGDDNATH